MRANWKCWAWHSVNVANVLSLSFHKGSTLKTTCPQLLMLRFRIANWLFGARCVKPNCIGGESGVHKKDLRSQEWVSKESQLCFCFLSNISQLFLLEPLQCSSRYISPSTIREKYVIGRPYNKVAWTFYCENRRGGRLYKRSPVFYVLFSVIESTLRKKGPNCCYFITLLEQTCDVTETPNNVI